MIVIDESAHAFTLHTDHTTYQMRVDEHGYLLHLYYGEHMEGVADHLLRYVDHGSMSASPYDVKRRDYSLDWLPQELPFVGQGDFRAPALVVRDSDGFCGCDLRYVGYGINNGKFYLPGMPSVYDDSEDAQTLSVRLRDNRLGLQVELIYGVLPELDVITRAACVTNNGDKRVTVERLASVCLDFVHGDFDLLGLYGRHAWEHVAERTRVGHARLELGSSRGASSHQCNPAAILCDCGAGEDHGRAWGLVQLWSGGFVATAERDQFEQTRVTMGLGGNGFAYPLDAGERLLAPEVAMTYSGSGLERVSHRMHRCLREHVARGPWRDAPRPVLLNSWEARYFDFTGVDLLRLADRAAAAGMDMLVMDDGWFGHRNDDTTSLGDWQVNEAKLGMSLAELVAGVRKRGLRFGIWFEPEMVSEDSKLYTEHPDWALAAPGKKPAVGRDQLLLDLSRPEVRGYLFDQISAVLDQAPIDYVKWDFNRSVVDAWSRVAGPGLQGRVAYDFVLGLYDLLERLRDRYPDLLVEGCSAGGGRFDAGMLYYTPQIWTSDNTDALDRLFIQYGTSFVYPCSAVGAHVSAVPNATTGRTVGLDVRGTAAMAGAGFGYELDLLSLGDSELAAIRAQVEAWRSIEHLVREGDYYRLSDPATDAVAAWAHVASDGNEALVMGVVTDVHGYGVVPYVTPRGLDRGARYRDVATGRVYDADALMCEGLPVEGPVLRLHLVRV